MKKNNFDRDIVFWLFWIFAVFSLLLFGISFTLSKKIVESSMQERYSIVSKCFSFTIGYIFDDVKTKANILYENVEESFTKENIEKAYGVLLRTDPTIAGIVALNDVRNVVFATSEELLEQSLQMLRLTKPGEKQVNFLLSQGNRIFAVGIYIDEYILVLYQDMSPVLKAAEEQLGGKFKIISEKEMDDTTLSRLASLKIGQFTTFKEGKFMDVYYYAYRSLDGSSYYIYWKERRDLTPIIVKILAVVLGLSAPMFVILILLLKKVKKKIYVDFVVPMNRMLEVLEKVVFATSTSSEELAASSEELAASTRELEDKGRTLSYLSREMLDDMEQTHDFSKEVASFSEFLIKYMKEFERMTSELAGAIQEIYTMGNLIQQIGERIVVLSINASIESSRETIDRQAIKTLAEEIGKLSETTTQRVSEIFTALQNSQEKIDELTDAFMNISKETERLNEGSVKLFEMIEKNRKSSEEITEAVEGIFSVIEEVNFASQNLAEAATELSKKAYDVQRIVEEIKGERIRREETIEEGEGYEKEGGEDV